jgi:hypothetical protein
MSSRAFSAFAAAAGVSSPAAISNRSRGAGAAADAGRQCADLASGEAHRAFIVD